MIYLDTSFLARLYVRQPGSIGAAAYPARVFKGIRMSGHMGARQVTQRGLQIVDRDVERNLLLVKGAVPGANDGLLLIKTPGRLYKRKVRIQARA